MGLNFFFEFLFDVSIIMSWGVIPDFSMGPVSEQFWRYGQVGTLSLTVDQKIAPSAFYKGHFKELLVIYDYF